MKFRSLRMRLLAAASLSVMLALLLAGWGLLGLFEAHVERRLDSELEAHLRQLVGGIEIHDDDERIHQQIALADPRFSEPYSGLYWQIQDDHRATLLRSRSLWDQTLALPADELMQGDVHRHHLSGPQGQTLLVREQQVIFRSHSQPRILRFAVALNREDIRAAGKAFAADIWPYLLLLAVFLMLASTLQVLVGLSPMKRVRTAVAEVRSGRVARLRGQFPDEVAPLVDEINELLSAADAAVEKARSWTGDLAHGLKTPLTALSTDIQRLHERGHADIAAQLEPLIEDMRMRLERELLRARLRSHTRGQLRRSQQRVDLLKVLTGLQSILVRGPSDNHLDWRVEYPDSLPSIAMQQADLTELLGNLLDNAHKWAKSCIRVRLDAVSQGRLCIEDDGPGVAEQALDRLGQRGLRLDESMAGYGLGLAIVRDICEAYAIEFEFSSSELGGLSICLQLPLSDKRDVE